MSRSPDNVLLSEFRNWIDDVNQIYEIYSLKRIEDRDYTLFVENIRLVCNISTDFTQEIIKSE